MLHLVPPLAHVPGVIRFRFLYTIGSEIATGWHMYFWTGSPPTQGQADSAAQAAHTAYVNSLKAFHGADRTLTAIQVMDLSSATGPASAWNGAEPGTRAGGSLPASSALLVNFLIHRRYRGGKPRIYIPAGTDSDVATAQTWTGAFTSTFGAAWAVFGPAILANLQSWAPGAYQCNVSYYSGHQWLPDQNGNYHRVPTPRVTPLVDQIYANNFNGIFGTQRRRLRPG